MLFLFPPLYFLWDNVHAFVKQSPQACFVVSGWQEVDVDKTVNDICKLFCAVNLRNYSIYLYITNTMNMFKDLLEII